MQTQLSYRRLACVGIALAALLAGTASTRGQEYAGGYNTGQSGESLANSPSAAYPKGEFLAHLTAARGGDGSCAPGSACDWGWGCGGSPFLTGPGMCDDFRVGPRWTSKVSGMFLFRKNTNLSALAGAATAGADFVPPAAPIDVNAADTLTTNFDNGAGARLSISSYYPQLKGYALQIGYMGVFGWDAGAFDPEVPFAGPLPPPPGVEQKRNLTYWSSLHSLEINAQSVSDGAIATFGGVRYVLFAENVNDFLDQSSQFPQIPPNADDGIVGDPPLDVTDILRGVSVDNNLIGFHGGLRSDLLRVGQRFFFEGFVDAGVYGNLIVRKSAYVQKRTYVALDDPSTALVDEGVNSVNTTTTGYRSERQRVAFIGEALLGGVYEINRCSRGRLGYQVLYLKGVELGDEAFIGAGPTSGDLLMHGWYAGFEYQR